MHEKNEILPYNTSCCPILDSHICYYFYSWKASLYRTHSENKIFPAKFSEFFKTKFYFIPSPKWYVTSQGSSTSCKFNFFWQKVTSGKLIAFEKLFIHVLTYTGVHLQSTVDMALYS